MNVPRQTHQLTPNLSLVVYGVKKYRTLSENMEQAFYVTVEGKARAFYQLRSEHKGAVRRFLWDNYPQHARLLS